MASEKSQLHITKKQAIYFDWVVDVLLYTLILNVFVEYTDLLYIESFSISIFTAIVLKFLLNIIIKLEHKVSAFFKSKEGKIFKVLNGVTAFLILFLSKFVILEVIDIIFGEKVEINGFIAIILIIITMIGSKKLLEYSYKRLGE